ncbi:hypothetical protein L538_0092 [Bordetella hinzii 4161]|nr:hypothetical protein L538_0092 [Bordetella hinzii 4161]
MAADQNYLRYETDIVLNQPGDGKWRRERKRWHAIFRILPKFDVVHYNFGTTVAQPHQWQMTGFARPWHRIAYWLRAKYLWGLQYLELASLRRRGIPIFMTYQGDDARQGAYQRQNFEIHIASQVGPQYYSAASDRFKQASIRRMDAWCDMIYALNPDLLRVLPARTRFLPYGHVFLDEWLPVYNQREDRPLRIVHAPSHRGVKGTELVLAALERLKAQGYHFELILVENMANAQARLEYERADVLVDQLFAGWYGGLAVELMALGKPVIVYIRDEDLAYLPEGMAQDLPFIRSRPDEIEQTLRAVLEMPRKDLHARALASRAFVEKWHDPMRIAAGLIEDYRSAVASRLNRA